MGIGYPAIPTTSDLIISYSVEEGRLLGLAQFTRALRYHLAEVIYRGLIPYYLTNRRSLRI
jgi:hypothetical protein